MTNEPSRIQDGNGIPITSTDLGSGHRGLDFNATLSFGGFQRLTKTFTRSATVTAYAANNCLACSAPGPTTQNLANAGRVVGGSGSIVRAVMKTDLISWTNPVSVVIYDVAVPATWIADYAAFDVKWADAANIVGILQFTGFSKDATGAAACIARSNILDGLDIPYNCGVADQNLYFQCWLPSGTPTPANAQNFLLNIGVVRD